MRDTQRVKYKVTSSGPRVQLPKTWFYFSLFPHRVCVSVREREYETLASTKDNQFFGKYGTQRCIFLKIWDSNRNLKRRMITGFMWSILKSTVTTTIVTLSVWHKSFWPASFRGTLAGIKEGSPQSFLYFNQQCINSIVFTKEAQYYQYSISIGRYYLKNGNYQYWQIGKFQAKLTAQVQVLPGGPFPCLMPTLSTLYWLYPLSYTLNKGIKSHKIHLFEKLAFISCKYCKQISLWGLGGTKRPPLA